MVRENAWYRAPSPPIFYVAVSCIVINPVPQEAALPVTKKADERHRTLRARSQRRSLFMFRWQISSSLGARGQRTGLIHTKENGG